jgi:hypothetical protein
MYHMLFLWYRIHCLSYIGYDVLPPIIWNGIQSTKPFCILGLD